MKKKLILLILTITLCSTNPTKIQAQSLPLDILYLWGKWVVCVSSFGVTGISLGTALQIATTATPNPKRKIIPCLSLALLGTSLGTCLLNNIVTETN